MVEGVSLSKSVRHKLDPLDQEMLERAFDATWTKVKGKDAVDFDSDDGLESILRQELIEIACCVLYGVSDPEALRKMLLSQPGAEDSRVSEQSAPGTEQTQARRHRDVGES
jgi:hypothetical protein